MTQIFQNSARIFAILSLSIAPLVVPPLACQSAQDESTSQTTGTKTSGAVQRNMGLIDSVKRPWNADAVTDKSMFGESFSFQGPGAKEAERITYEEHADHVAASYQPAFKKLLITKQTVPKILFSEAAKSKKKAEAARWLDSISPVLGPAIADNDLTVAKGRSAPFHVTVVKIRSINGRNVLAIDGTTDKEDDPGKPIKDGHGYARRYFSGIFIPPLGEAPVGELYLVADDLKSFNKDKVEFDSILKTIKWNTK